MQRAGSWSRCPGGTSSTHGRVLPWGQHQPLEPPAAAGAAQQGQKLCLLCQRRAQRAGGRPAKPSPGDRQWTRHGGEGAPAQVRYQGQGRERCWVLGMDGGCSGDSKEAAVLSLGTAVPAKECRGLI